MSWSRPLLRAELVSLSLGSLRATWRSASLFINMGNRSNRTKRAIRLGIGAGFASAAALLLSYCAFRSHFNLSTAGFLDLLAIVLIALRIGFWEATSASLMAVACLDYFFAPPIYSFHIADAQNWVAITAFELTALIVSRLSIQVQEHMQDAVLHRRNAERLYELSRSILLLNPRKAAGHQITQLIRTYTDIEGVALFVASASQSYKAGICAGEDEELARNAYLLNEDHPDLELHKYQRVLRSGRNPIGAIVLSGSAVTPLMADAIASLAASAMERARAFYKESRAEAARQSEQLRTTVLDALAHAFKTPLTVILTSTSGLLEMDGLNAGQAELVHLIDEQAVQLNALTTHLLRMAKLESSEIRLRREDVSVPQVVEDVVAKCTDHLGGHSVQVSIADNSLNVYGDRELLTTTITELIVNATKYSAPGSSIMVSAEEKSDGRVLIGVHNEGSLIGPEERELIFERFYRSPAIKDRVSGSGIGLSIAKKSAEAHQGSIWVTSSRETGTTFFLSLPTARREYESVAK